MIALCAFAGLRIGEASAVQLGDVGFLTRRLHVQRQVQYEGGAPSFTPRKAGSERKVALADRLLLMLSQLVEQVGVSGAERGLVVGPPRPGVIRRAWVNTLAAADVPHTKLHDLRHFSASGLIAAGCDPVTVQRALGHASATTTMSIYAHLWPTAEDTTRAAANDLMAASTDAPADSLRTGQARCPAETRPFRPRLSCTSTRVPWQQATAGARPGAAGCPPVRPADDVSP